MAGQSAVGLGRPSLGKMAFVGVRIHRELLNERRMAGLHFWASGYWVSTVGLDEATVRKYIREQEDRDNKQSQLFE